MLPSSSRPNTLPTSNRPPPERSSNPSNFTQSLRQVGTSIRPPPRRIPIPQEHAQELRDVSNPQAALVQPAEPAVPNYKGQPQSAARVYVQNSLVFTIFVLLVVPVFIFMFLCFVPGFVRAVNKYFLGVFKRRQPDDPGLYFDVNCINSMNYSDFMNTNQVARCALERPINRPGPPRVF